MNKSFVILVFIFLICVIGCATAPKQYDFNPVATIEASYDEVWSSVVEYFAVGSLPINTIEKDSGLIVSSWMDASKNGFSENKTYCDCGGAGISTQRWTRGKFNVFVKNLADGSVDLRITCSYQQGRSFSDVNTTVNCESTGFLESQIHEYVKAKISGDPIPSVPSFKPAVSE